MNTTKTRVTIAGRRHTPGADGGVAALLTSASWVLQRLPGQVLEEQRSDLVKTLGAARSAFSAAMVADQHRPPVVQSALHGRQRGVLRSETADRRP